MGRWLMEKFATNQTVHHLKVLPWTTFLQTNSTYLFKVGSFMLTLSLGINVGLDPKIVLIPFNSRSFIFPLIKMDCFLLSSFSVICWLWT
jgi:hypothetical protein